MLIRRIWKKQPFYEIYRRHKARTFFHTDTFMDQQMILTDFVEIEVYVDEQRISRLDCTDDTRTCVVRKLHKGPFRALDII